MTVLYIAYHLLNHAYYVPVVDMLENEIKNYLKFKKKFCSPRTHVSESSLSIAFCPGLGTVLGNLLLSVSNYKDP